MENDNACVTARPALWRLYLIIAVAIVSVIWIGLDRNEFRTRTDHFETIALFAVLYAMLIVSKVHTIVNNFVKGDENGIEWKRNGKSGRVSWEQISAFYDEIIRDGRRLTWTRCVVVTPDLQITFYTEWNNAGDLKKMIVRKATQAVKKGWTTIS